ncbi:HlyD family efflux transporter periplasmic adaptor subunit [Pantanalinema rosaneae CENA516]|uniref:HlyD family efflux transporter periplasmic adaptor subunit n=1 Tax=Pantanalinema rosaneae TaxID=1620701 RepID=UPI003D6FF613
MASLPERGTQTTSEPALASAKTPHWSASLQTVLDQPPPSLPSRLALGGTLFFLIFATWAWFGHIDEVAKAPGKLVPKGQVYKINPIELGKVVNIAVREGETVKAGQLLVELDTEVVTKEVERLEKALLATQIEIVQAEGMLDKNQLQAKTQAEIARAAIQEQQVTINQAKLTAENNRSIVAQLQEDAAAQKQRLERLRPLREIGAIPAERLFEGEQMLRDRQRTITESQGNLERAAAEMQRLQVGLEERRSNAERVRLEAQQNIQELKVKLTGLQAKYSETQVLLAAARAKLKQRYLYAPADGVILTLNVHRQGEVVQAGQAIAEIAPTGEPLVLSALLPSQEAGFVRPGMPVQIKQDAYPFQDYGMSLGHVSSISPDSRPDEQLGQVYRVEIDLAQDYINVKGNPIQFKPGQTAIGEIITRRRRIADVLLDPLKKLQSSTSL